MSVTISGPAEAVKVGSQVKIKVVLKNISSHELGISKAVGPGEFDYELDIRDDKGIKVAHTKYGRDISPEEGGGISDNTIIVPLPPGGTETNTITISKIHDMSRPGRYTVQVRRYEGDSKSWINSNTITVTITQ